MMQSALDGRVAADRYIDGLASRPGDWLTERRRAAAYRIEALGFPSSRLEGWRYTRLDELLKNGFTPTDAELPATLPEQIERLPLLGAKVGVLVFVDGVLHPGLSCHDSKALSVTALRNAMSEGDQLMLASVGALAGEGRHAFSAFNMATMQDGALIRVAPGTTLEAPLELLHITTDNAHQRMLRPRHSMQIGESSRVEVIERYLSLTEKPYFTNMVCEIELGEGAILDHQRVQQEGEQAYHLSELHLRLGGEACYRGANAAIGARWSRTEINGNFSERGASLELAGLYLAGDGQLADFHLDIDHGVPECESNVNFKGLVYGRGRAVFDGSIRVQRQSQKTQAHLSNANLMLSRRSEIDTKPQLEILADDVQCSHGTTVGQLDPEALYYLRSRGLDLESARRLLCLGFAHEIVDSFGHEQLRSLLIDEIKQRVEFNDAEGN